ncbi:general secretion pathway protein E [Asticcacaulis biprosthecium C19]|uniref:General secretion pathway protein E n=1 Tax=Asticcacaulis biprosthecium C19 TaxID=715226 RepID=F4QHZ7_9CAUL|nr:GspE/PulE family protein [Asticcacaulis biprosthecium]EGF92864.1 general secretion pathway protein E [Asticcacaulis biprosthecium C19]
MSAFDIIRDDVLDHLLETGHITPEAVGRARSLSDRTAQPVEQVLNQLGLLSDDDLARAYAEVTGLPLWDPDRDPPRTDNKELGLGQEFLRKVRVVPLRLEGERLVCAACDPFDDEMKAGLSFATGRDIVFEVARLADWRRVFDAEANDVQGDSFMDERRIERDLAFVEDHSVEGLAVELVAQAFAAAVDRNASDIHFEPRRNDLLIRLRVDGRLVDYATAPADLVGPCVSRIKVLSNLNVGERRLPQDGRASFINAGRSIDVRVATSPTVFGEGAVLRLLDRANAPQSIPALSFPVPVIALLEKAVRAPHGLFLVTGPTGSGKTTTLYALLAAFRGSGKKILSVEDPVERHFDHVSQTQVQSQIGLTFASALRSFLRQDPDVILVGEIRDTETAAVAVQAAMTGHLVLASVHANTALAVAPRLRDMGVEPYQLAASVKGVMAQRLVRRLCDCKAEVPVSEALAVFAQKTGVPVPGRQFEARGCPKCRGIGYAGRIALAEGVWADDAFLTLVADGAHLEALKSWGRASGQTSMVGEGLRRIGAGETTLDEIMVIADE